VQHFEMTLHKEICQISGLRGGSPAQGKVWEKQAFGLEISWIFLEISIKPKVLQKLA